MPHILHRGGILAANFGAWCLGKGAFALPALQHFVRLAGKCTGSFLTVYFALVAELNGQRTFELLNNFLDKGNDQIEHCS